MREPIRLLIVDALPESRSLLVTMLGFDGEMVVVGQVGTGTEALAFVESHSPDLILVSDTIGFEEVPKVVWQITSRSRIVGVVVISARTEPDDLRRAMLAGARGFVGRPVDSRELRSTIHEVYARVNEERRDREERVVAPTGPLVLRRGGALGHTIAVFGAKGGVGKTTVSVNLAVAVRQMTNRSVALIDADLSFGDAGLFLDLSPIHTILDVAEAIGPGPATVDDAEIIKGYFARYEPLGMRVLLSPSRPEHADLISATHLQRLFATLPRIFDFTIIDCPIAYDDRVLALFDYADQIIFLVTPEVGPLKNARHFLDLCETLGYPRDRVQVALNRADSQVSINVNDVQRWLAYPVSHQIQSGGARVAEAANRGVPLVIHDPRNPTSRDILALARAVIRSADQMRKNRGTDTLEARAGP